MKIQKALLIINSGIIILLAASCDFPGKSTKTEQTPDHQARFEQGNAIAGDSGKNQVEAKPAAANILPENLETITSENASDLVLLHELPPEAPPVYAFSPDSSRMAISAGGTIEVIETTTGSTVLTLNTNMPECPYGFGKTMAFNADGNFLTILGNERIQVWQTGGGMIFETAYKKTSSTPAIPCGAELPQLALSPDGLTLAVSGLDDFDGMRRQYFRVFDVLKNEILYEWDRKPEKIHGRLYGYPGLGFSDDGRYIQTFDPLGTVGAKGITEKAFRFWSVGDWQEVDGSSADVLNAFGAGVMRFGVSEEGMVRIIEKGGGRLVSEIPATGCKWDQPCEVGFSSDGKKALLLPREGEMIHFRSTAFYPAVQVWDLSTKTMVVGQTGIFRGLEDVSISAAGELVLGESFSDFDPDGIHWWVSRDLFQGIAKDKEGHLTFVPAFAGIMGKTNCRYCATCTLNLPAGEIECQPGITTGDGNYSVELREDAFWLVSHTVGKEGAVGKLSLPQENTNAGQRIRLLRYFPEAFNAIYCLDKSARPQDCYIDLLDESRNIKTLEDISFIQVAIDQQTAAFIDQSAHKLYLYDIGSQSLSEKSHYQARAAAVNPVFSADGSELFYLVENLNKAGDYSLEVIDTLSGKVQSRKSLSAAKIAGPSALAASRSGDLLAVAGKDGIVTVFTREGKLLYKEHIEGQADLIGVAFLQEDQLLAVMDSTGRLSLWGIKD